MLTWVRPDNPKFLLRKLLMFAGVGLFYRTIHFFDVQPTITMTLFFQCSIGSKKMSDEVLAWLSVWSEVQTICKWFSWCHCHPIISCFIKIQINISGGGSPRLSWRKRPLNRCLSFCSTGSIPDCGVIDSQYEYHCGQLWYTVIYIFCIGCILLLQCLGHLSLLLFMGWKNDWI